MSAWKFDGVTRALSDARVGWFYTWSSGRGGIKAPAGVEFVPMMHDAGSVTAAELHGSGLYNGAKAKGRRGLPRGGLTVPASAHRRVLSKA
ncbi:glycosyl hydrolase [Streptomyces sp. Tu102]|uniref:glycosyl hydrolase n=1 Tax=Streptomyces TaxID=1883 RepID=UPI001BDD71CE|nr:glycosyl hydrolase [Streptomyces sp. Tu102]MBT1093493.1 glycoside hydrolase family protein [Streptomyces sp. Tu102]